MSARGRIPKAFVIVNRKYGESIVGVYDTLRGATIAAGQRAARGYFGPSKLEWVSILEWSGTKQTQAYIHDASGYWRSAFP